MCYLVPTRNTSYSHLRDGFMRSLQSRMALSRERGLLLPDEEAAAQSPLRKLKTVFPNTPLGKGTPLDIILTAPTIAAERVLIVRDLGSVQSTVVGRDFVMAYFEGNGISPPVRSIFSLSGDQHFEVVQISKGCYVLENYWYN
jgi:hypothetical protein